MENVSYFENELFRIVEKVVNLIKLNFIWLLFSIPVVTIGAANCALYEISVKIAKNEEGYIFRDFTTAFKQNWKGSFRIWLFYLFVGAGLHIDTVFWNNTEGDLAVAMVVFTRILKVVWFLFILYTFPLITKIKNREGITIRNAALLVFKYLPASCYMILWIAILWIAGKFWAPVFFAEILMGVSLAAFICNKVITRILEKEKVFGDSEQ